MPHVDGGSLESDGGALAGDLEIERTGPITDTVYVRDALTIQLTVRGRADRVELVVDDVVLTDLAPPYTYSWDTRTTAEGPHIIVARATRGSDVAMTAPLNAIVDRTSPRVVAHSPAAGELNAWLGAPIELSFDEPLAPDTVDDTFITLSAADALGLAKTTTLAADAASIELRLAAVPALPAVVRVDVGVTAADLAGNPVIASTFSFTAPAWARIGATVDPPETAIPWTGASFAIDETGEAACAVYGEGALVSCFDGTSWARLGGALSTGTASYRTAIALDAVESPVVAWSQPIDPSGAQVRVARWNGAAWQPIGDGLPPTTVAGPISLVLDDAGNPIVAWVRDQTVLHVHHWNGTAWVELGSPVLGSYVSAIDLARTRDGRPVVAWATAQCHVRSWTGTGWSEHGASVTTDSEMSCGDVSLALDPADAPVVAVYMRSSRYTPYTRVHAWEAGTWAPMTSGFGLFRCSMPELAIAGDGTPTLAFYDGNSGAIGVRIEQRASDGTWFEMGYFPQHQDARLVLYGGVPAFIARRGDDLEAFRSNEL